MSDREELLSRIADLEREREALAELVQRAHAQIEELQRRLVAARAAVGVVG